MRAGTTLNDTMDGHAAFTGYNAAMTAIQRYRDLRGRVDRLAEELTQLHGVHVVCRPGCSECCVNLTVFPVEYAAIAEELKADGVKGLQLDPTAACAFLKHDLCQIYTHRPIICRTHGLPIAFTNTDAPGEPTSVSFCPRNFANADFDEYEFGPQNTLDLDALNEELARINAAYEAEQAHATVSPRIALIQLKDDLR